MAGESAAAPMDVEEEEVATPAPPLPIFSVNVLEIIKTAQAQHGGRYGDYQRYRRYCFSRLRRLYKSLKFLHGRGKYTPRPLEAATVTDVRHLHIPLYLAERAWSYAMELKQIESGPDLARKRAHLIRRLTKAAKWGTLFASLCSQRADSKTALEAEAYASYLWGNVLLEKETDWESALSKFLRARAVYEQLGKVGEVDHQVRCRLRCEELEPNIRYCYYKLGRANAPDSTSLLQLGESSAAAGGAGAALDLLSSKLEAVMEEAREQQVASMTELTWLGLKLPVHNSKTRISILKAQELEAELAKSGTSRERQLALYDKIFVTYQDAKRQIRDDTVTAGSTKDVEEELTALGRAVSCLLLQRTLERNLVLVAVARSRLERQEAGVRDEKIDKEKPAKPEDLVRLHDILIQNVSDLLDIVGAGREARMEEREYVEEQMAKRAAYEAIRCFYVAQSFAAAQKLAEAYVLYHRATNKTEEALRDYEQLASQQKEAEEEIKKLASTCRAQRCLVHAQAVTESLRAAEGIHEHVEKLSFKESRSREAAQYLLEFLDEYKSALGPQGSKQAPVIMRVPPPFRAVPCRPIVLDTALNTIVFPSLEGRTKKEAKKSAGGILNFWRK